MSNENMSLEDAKQFLADNIKKGTHCLCCEQFAKIYKRSVYGAMAERLIHLYRLDAASPGSHFHVTEIFDAVSEAREFAILSRFGLIEELKPNPSFKTKTSGHWKITSMGKSFVEGKTTIPKYLLIFDSKTMGFDGDLVNIQDCLGDSFNYQELMSA